MKYSEFIRWLKRQGVTFESGKAAISWCDIKDAPRSVPAMAQKEMPEPLRKAILKDLGLQAPRQPAE